MALLERDARIKAPQMALQALKDDPKSYKMTGVEREEKVQALTKKFYDQMMNGSGVGGSLGSGGRGVVDVQWPSS